MYVHEIKWMGWTDGIQQRNAAVDSDEQDDVIDLGSVISRKAVN